MKPGKSLIKCLAPLAATTLVVAACGGSSNRPMPPAQAGNASPVISGIPNQMADQDTPLNIDFGVQDSDTAAGSLMVGAVANGTELFPADGVALSGDGATRTLTLTPLEAATGTALITINVADPQGAYTTRAFKVAVNAKYASLRGLALDTFAKGEADTPTVVNGWTFQQDADDPATFAALIPGEQGG
jgi:hypothetical protein